jgi:four helix bundle protein
MAEIESYRDLWVWQAAIEIAVDCYKMTKQLPREELYGLTSQIRRAASSIPANIAEGHGRGSTKEYCQFLRTARASLKELETHLILSHRVDLLSEHTLHAFLTRTEELGRMLTSLHQKLQTRMESGD